VLSFGALFLANVKVVVRVTWSGADTTTCSTTPGLIALSLSAMRRSKLASRGHGVERAGVDDQHYALLAPRARIALFT